MVMLYTSNNDKCTNSETQLRLFMPSSWTCAYQLNDVTKPFYITVMISGNRSREVKVLSKIGIKWKIT